MSTKSNKSIANVTVIGIDIGKNSFHIVGQDQRIGSRAADRCALITTARQSEAADLGTKRDTG